MKKIAPTNPPVVDWDCQLTEVEAVERSLLSQCWTMLCWETGRMLCCGETGVVFWENWFAGDKPERRSRGVHHSVNGQLVDDRSELPDVRRPIRQHHHNAAVARSSLRRHERAVRAGSARGGAHALLPPPAGHRARPPHRLPRHHWQDGARRERDATQQGPDCDRRRPTADAAAAQVQVSVTSLYVSVTSRRPSY